ncbi:MAG: hypothetical protein QM765_05870 [Myxococcales bacterium]
MAQKSRVLLPVASLAALVLACGCEEKKQARKYDDALTIVVEADKTRLAEQEAALAERSKSIEAENEKLKALYEKVEAAQAGPGTGAPDPQAAELAKLAMKLVKERQEMDAQQKAMIKEQQDLIHKVTEGGRLPVAAGTGAAPVAPTAPAPAPANTAAVAELTKMTGQVAGREKELAGRERSLAEREASLAEREKGLAQREAALATRDSACASAAAAAASSPRTKKGAAGPGLDKAEIEKAYKALLAAMTSKGVLASDLPPAKQKALSNAASFNKGELAAAQDAIEQVQATVDMIVIDGAFVTEKSKRVDALQRANKSGKAKDELSKLVPEMARAYSDGRWTDANRVMNNIVHLLEK